ncbi:MAG: hypothetical protein KDB92_05875, partial [Chitinophagaceae bacterium]|nr:hypothetical protein [Chitinophagaceae bacterium]
MKVKFSLRYRICKTIIMMKRMLPYVLITALLIGCSQNPLTGKSQLTLLPESELQTMAVNEYQQFLSKNKVVSNSSNKDAAMVQRVGNRIINAVKTYYAEHNISDKLKGFNWEV